MDMAIVQICSLGVVVIAQVGLTAFTIGKMRGMINGLNGRVENVEHGNRRAHKRIDEHVDSYHTKGRK